MPFFSLKKKNTYSINQTYTVMKTLVEYMNETLENTLELEIAKILSDEQNETETLESYFQKVSEQLEYNRYQQVLKNGLFEGTYQEYKERIKLGAIGCVQIF